MMFEKDSASLAWTMIKDYGQVDRIGTKVSSGDRILGSKQAPNTPQASPSTFVTGRPRRNQPTVDTQLSGAF